MGDQIRTADLQHFVAVDAPEPFKKIRHLRRRSNILRNQASNDPPPLGDLDLFTLVQQALDLLEIVTKV
ncbi:MAG: hypothetical protein WBC30_17970, partial [Candidatus Sulfotelmatobacter sp.]